VNALPDLIALDGTRVITRPSADQFAEWAHAAHVRDCGACSSGHPCQRGRQLADTANADSDIPGYEPI
jgi:hypothetical protein